MSVSTRPGRPSPNAKEVRLRVSRLLRIVSPQLFRWGFFAVFSCCTLASPIRAAPCATLERLAIARDLDPMAHRGRSAHGRPVSVQSVASEAYPIRVHAPAGNWESRTTAIVQILEDAWLRQVVQQGYPAPLGDGEAGGDARLDVYIGLTEPAAALTLAEVDADGTRIRNKSSAYIVVDAGLDGDQLAPVLHHEFAHAVQFGIDLRETLMFFEASAVAQEYFWDRDRDFESLSWGQDVPDFQRFPNASIFLDGVSLQRPLNEVTFFEYGAVLFLLFLEQEYGDADGTFIRSLWTASEQSDDEEGIEPDWLDSLASRIDLPFAVLRFAQWRTFIASRALAGEGLQGGGSLSGASLARVRRFLTPRFDGSAIAITGPNRVMPTGCYLFAFNERSGADEELQLRVRMPISTPDDAGPADSADDETRFGVLLWREPREQGPVSLGSWLNDGEESMQVDFTVPPGEELWGAVCDTRRADADDGPSFSELEIRFGHPDLPSCAWEPEGCEVERADGGVGDDGDAGPTVTPAGQCGCQAAGSNPRGRSVGWLVLSGLGLLIFLARFRKAMLRRKMYREGLGARRNRPRT